MKAVAWTSLLAIAATVLIGCGEEPTNAPEDDAFQKSLAAAAEKHKGEAPKGRSLKAPDTSTLKPGSKAVIGSAKLDTPGMDSKPDSMKGGG